MKRALGRGDRECLSRVDAPIIWSTVVVIVERWKLYRGSHVKNQDFNIRARGEIENSTVRAPGRTLRA